MNISEQLSKYDYKNMLAAFAELSAVPRGSGHNEKISAFLCDFAKEHGFEYSCDSALNVIIKKPASKGYEDKPAVVIQGHMDMVCVKDPDCVHDFETDGLDLQMDGEWLSANGTTLGADDGISIAYMMALLLDDTLQSPELVCVITTDEETGMDGAYALDLSCIGSAKYLINVDSDIEGVCLCGCAGGVRIDGRLPLVRKEISGTGISIKLDKLRGGHSGAEIHKNITNAVRLMARILLELSDVCEYKLVSFEGGEKDNAIPSFATVELITETAPDKAAIQTITNKIYKYYSVKEPDMRLEVAYRENVKANAVCKESFDKLLYVLLEAPNGVQAMSREIDSLVETSLNLGIFKIYDDYAKFNYSLRSSVFSEKIFLSRRVRLMLENAGGSGVEKSAYPAWEYKSDSKLRDIYAEANEEILGKKAEITVIHAGLECGLFSEKLPELDMISIGPEMYDIHSPRERLNVASAVRVYKIVERLLSKIN